MNRKLLGLKNRYSFYIEICIYMVFFYAISACVYLNGDDFMYATFAKEGIFSNVADYYMTGNGRFWINILDSALLYFDRVLFVMLNPLVILAFIILLAKNIKLLAAKSEDKTSERTYIRYGMVMFAALNVFCMRETVFWITGMMNYLFPAVVFLFAIWIFQIVRLKSDITVLQKLLYCVLCFFAASSVEQYALMFVGFCTLILAFDLIRKRKIKGFIVLGYLVALAGLAALIFAPGNFARVDEQTTSSLIDDAWTLIHQNIASSVAFPFTLMLSSCCCTLIHKEKGRKISMLSACVPLGLLLIRIIPSFENALVISAVFVGIVAQLLYCFVCCRYDGKVKIIALIFVGVGSQIMLMISDVWGYRCMFSMYTVYMLLIGFCLSRFPKEDSAFILCAGAVGSICPLALTILWILKIVQIKNRSVAYIVSRAVTVIATVVALLVLFIGYNNNRTIHKMNIQNTLAAEESGKIRLYELEDDTFSWYFIPMGEFHENYYRRYHGLSNEIEFEYIEK